MELIIYCCSCSQFPAHRISLSSIGDDYCDAAAMVVEGVFGKVLAIRTINNQGRFLWSVYTERERHQCRLP